MSLGGMMPACKHPYLLTVVDRLGRTHTRSFKTAKARGYAKAALTRDGVKYTESEQLQLLGSMAENPQAPSDPRYNIPY